MNTKKPELRANANSGNDPTASHHESEGIKIMTTVTETTVITPEIVERDRAIIAAAQAAPPAFQHVYPGTPEFDVIERWAGGCDLSNVSTAHLWHYLTSMTFPHVPFTTPCPSWCNLDHHETDTLRTDHRTCLTDHCRYVTETADYAVWVKREDVRDAYGNVTIGSPCIVFACETGFDTSTDGLRTFAADLASSAATVERLLSAEAVQ
ncbi:hypothetical protein HQQ80_07015 [Microbacteriaceae bacterium VKM Ac-2855]|nr:hypothetical protein [Microbacteriaceae bacterium VKM Ac-2855]